MYSVNVNKFLPIAYKSYYKRIYKIKGGFWVNSLELTGAITALANIISCRLTTDEAVLLASIFVQLGDTLATIATQRSVCEKAKEK